MIYTVTLNLNLDLIYETNNLNIGDISRARLQTISVGGKGINISRALKSLGADSQALGFLGGSFKSFITQNLNQEGIDADLLPIEGSSRVNIKIVHETINQVTEINEYGPRISPAETRAILAQIEQKAMPGDYFVLAGSIPAGMDDRIYEDIIEICHHRQARVLLDASGKALSQGIKAKPDFLCINKDELKSFNPASTSTPEKIGELVDVGIEAVLITAGPDDSFYRDSSTFLKAKPPPVQGKYTVGSGDSVNAGFIYGIKNQLPASRILPLAIACGSANLLTGIPGKLDTDQIKPLQDKIKVHRLF